MHPLTCYAGQISLCQAKIEKISNKCFVMINKDGGGGTFGFMGGGHNCYEEDIELMGVPPIGKALPGMAVFGRSAVVSPAFKKQFYKELQTPFYIIETIKQWKTIEN